MRQVYFCKTGKSVSHLCQNVTKRGLLVNYRLLRKVDEMCSCNQDLTVVVIIVVMICFMPLFREEERSPAKLPCCYVYHSFPFSDG